MLEGEILDRAKDLREPGTGLNAQLDEIGAVDQTGRRRHGGSGFYRGQARGAELVKREVAVGRDRVGLVEREELLEVRLLHEALKGRLAHLKHVLELQMILD